MKITSKQYETQQLVHEHGGNGWALVEDIDSAYCRVIGASLRLGNQAFLAAKSQLAPERRPIVENGPDEDILISPGVMKDLSKLRAQLKAGTHRVVNTRIVPA